MYGVLLGGRYIVFDTCIVFDVVFKVMFTCAVHLLSM